VTIVIGLPVSRAASSKRALRPSRGRVRGRETLDPALFAPLYSSLIGREITLAGIKPLLDGIEGVYRDNDYYALALVPPQDVSGGVIRVVVYESYIREVSIEGDDIAGIRNLQPRLQPYIDRMVEMRPVRISRLLRYALLMTDLAGLTINAEFSRIVDEPGAGRLVLKIDFDPSSFRARLDNFSSNSVGPLELAGNVRFNNAFGLFEWTVILLVTNPEAPEELVFGRFAQHVPLGPSGFAMGYEYSHVWSNPDEDATSTPRPARRGSTSTTPSSGARSATRSRRLALRQGHRGGCERRPRRPAGQALGEPRSDLRRHDPRRRCDHRRGVRQRHRRAGRDLARTT
jgi:hemolysin activation/secretion protein